MDPSQLSFNSLSLNEPNPSASIEEINDQNSNSNSNSENEQEESTTTTKTSSSTPYFFPPLWLGRRSKIFEILKEEGIGSVCDIGCGEGNVLSVCCFSLFLF